MPNNRIDNKNRIVYLDFLKSLATFLTVFYHLAYYKLDYGFQQGETYFPNSNRIVMCFASCCVPLFFMINGTLMLGKARNWKNIYWKAAKIMLLITLLEFLNFPSWFFRTLAIIYIFFPFFQHCYLKKRKVYYAICGGIFIVPFVYNLVVFIVNSIEAFTDINVVSDELHITGVFTMYSILYFLLGPLLNNRRLSLTQGIICILSGWLMVVVECTIYTNITSDMYDGVNAAFPTIGALLLSIGCYIVSQNLQIQKSEKFFCMIGNSALSIYLFHMMVISAGKFILGEFSLNVFTAVLGTVLVSSICVVLGKIVKKIPVICWFLRI